MAVNYGLGGFKDGAAYISASSSLSTPAEIEELDTPVSIKNTLTVDSFLLADIDVGGNSIGLSLDGFWLINYSITTTSGEDSDFTCGLAWADLIMLDQGKQSFHSKSGDFFTTNCTAIIKVSEGNRNVFMMIENNSNADDISISNLHITAIRIGDKDDGGLGHKGYKAGTAYGAVYFEGESAINYSIINHFYEFLITYSPSESCGMLLQTNRFTILQNGFYLYNCSISTRGSSNDDLTIGIFKNGLDQDDVLDIYQSFNSKGGNIWQTGLSTIMELKVGDTIQPCIANNTDLTGNTTFKDVNLNLIRLGNI